MCGVYDGLRLPRRTSAIWVARRPSVLPLASTTYQSRWRSEGLATKVFIRTEKRRAEARQPGNDRAPAGPRPGGLETAREALGGTAHRPATAARHPRQRAPPARTAGV